MENMWGLRSRAYPRLSLVQQWHTNNLIYIIIPGCDKESVLYVGVFFERLYLNMQGISIEDQARDDYGNNSPTKDLIQEIGRILPCTGCRYMRDEDWSKRREKERQKQKNGSW